MAARPPNPNMPVSKKACVTGRLPRMTAQPSRSCERKLPLDAARFETSILKDHMTIASTRFPSAPKRRTGGISTITMRSPARAGPIMRVKLNTIESSAMALGIKDLGTSAGTKAMRSG